MVSSETADRILFPHRQPREQSIYFASSSWYDDIVELTGNKNIPKHIYPIDVYNSSLSSYYKYSILQ